MDTFRLECFVALAEERHFGRAAERCNLSQPGLSQQIQKLEATLHVQLAVRSKRMVVLTPAGAAFLAEARRVIQQMDQAIAVAQQADAGRIGQLRLGITGSALYIVFPEIARNFRTTHPGVNILVEQMATSQAERSLRRGEIDVALVHPPLEDTELHCEMIAQPKFELAIPEGHHLSQLPRIPLSALAGEPLIMFPRDVSPQSFDDIIQKCNDAGVTPKIEHHAHPVQSIIAMVGSGFGIGFVASSVQRLTRGGVVYRPIQGDSPRLNLGIARRSDRVSRILSAFTDAAHAAVPTSLG